MNVPGNNYPEGIEAINFLPNLEFFGVCFVWVFCLVGFGFWGLGGFFLAF